MISKRRMAISLKFRLRHGQTTGSAYRQLQIRLTINGQTATDYGSGEYVRPDKWNYLEQKMVGRSTEAQALNDNLSEIYARHKEILRQQKSDYQAGRRPDPPTAVSVRAAWLAEHRPHLQPKAPDPIVKHPKTVLELMRGYIEHMRSYEGTEQAYSPKTLQNWEAHFNSVRKYLLKLEKTELTPAQTSRHWYKALYTWLLKRPMKAADAGRHLTHLRKVFEYYHEAGELPENPLQNYKPPTSPPKPVYFLEERHLTQLWRMKWLGEAGVALDWFRLICYTGMDAGDLARYVEDPASLEVETGDGVVIDTSRLKTGLRAQIPKLLEVDVILRRYPGGIPFMSGKTINTYTHRIEEELAFPQRITCKIGRKTAGALFLTMGFRLEAVSLILGHASVKTTERYYVKILPSIVHHEMRRLNSKEKPAWLGVGSEQEKQA
ncbi:tyrosine-type recombinase/integrase [Larkinella soli]|uniref:tyrosine-type recombinase/integrase n=1 Tax=Larkinella soli TaxID=1770527 RepID=UPI000FFB89F5|nr:phage integrase SAM-like domain-containing protein [Larkinella soli]